MTFPSFSDNLQQNISPQKVIWKFSDSFTVSEKA